MNSLYVYAISDRQRRWSVSNMPFPCINFLFLLFLLFARTAAADTVTVSWDANTPHPYGYKIYYKTSASGPPYTGTGILEGDSPITIELTELSDPDNPEYPLNQVGGTETYYFVVTAYDAVGNESGFSEEVPYIPSALVLSSLSISGQDSVTENSSASYIATATYSDGSTQVVTDSADWSEDADHTTINSSGVLTTTEVSINETVTLQTGFTHGGVTQIATKVVTITDIPASVTLGSLSIGGADSVIENNSSNYTATATFSDGSTQTVTNSVSWSENSSHANINSSGVLSTLEVSDDLTVIITASYTYDGITSTTTRSVTLADVPASVTLGSLSIGGADSVIENNSSNYTATATFSDGSTQTVTNSVSWSEASSYSNINSSGVLSALEVSDDQTVIITASYTYDGVTSTTTRSVTITDVPVAVTLDSLSIGGADSVIENNSANYTATATFSDGSTQAVTNSVSWSENSSHASINSSGVLSTLDVSGDETLSVQAGFTDGEVTRTATKGVTITNVPEMNLPPITPVIAIPYDGQTDCEMPLDIITEHFSDPEGDFHAQSRWQVSDQNDFSTLVLDTTSNLYLTALTVPHTVLKQGQTYYAGVRFFDTYLDASSWSNTVAFTTGSIFDDLDPIPNGIPDAWEVDDTVDFNLDGIPDNFQPETIKCIQAMDGSAYIGVEKFSDSISQIEALEVIDPTTIFDAANRPTDLIFGLFSFRLLLTEPGATARVRVYFSAGVFQDDVFYKYDAINGWYDYSDHATFNDDGQSVTLEIQDGGYGDSDGVANGIIVDPGGIASGGVVAGVSDGGSGSGGGGGGCFITTSAFD